MKRQFFNDKVIWITGASSGIGKELTLALSNAGAKLIISSPHLDKLERVKELVLCSDCSIRLLELDLSETDSHSLIVSQALAAFGHVDILINNAGIAMHGSVLETTLETDRTVMDVNYFGTISLTKALLPFMIARNSGTIATVTSVSGLYGIPKGAAYSASKHALHGFFDSLRQEIHETAVKITLIIPGVIDTDITIHGLSGDGSRFGKKLQIHREGYPVAACAREIIEGLKKSRNEIVTGNFRDRFSVTFWRYMPGSFYRALQNHPVAKMRKLKNRFLRS
jgi:short-subunit dehydrogenase